MSYLLNILNDNVVLYNRLLEKLYYRFGAYQIAIELLRSLFPDGEDKLPRLTKEFAQLWTLSALANSYSLSGQPRRAVPLFEMKNKLADKADDQKNLALGLISIATMYQIPIGELDAAESHLSHSIKICHKIAEEMVEATGHSGLGGLLVYRGKFEEAEKEFTKALDSFKKLDYDYIGIIWSYRSFRLIHMNNADEAFDNAKKAIELEEKGGFVGKLEREHIRIEWLLDAASLMKGNLPDAEWHLNKALIRDRKINLVEFEPNILLELAKLRFKQNHKSEALKFAQEALHIADRCEYRLKQADIHNFLAEFYLDSGDLPKAREHGESAKERAECGYVPALEKAEKLLKTIDSKST